MYGKDIEKIINANKIKIGDSITLRKGDKKISGIIMPSTSFDEPDNIIIKLKNGYNIGVKLSDYKIDSIEHKSFNVEFPSIDFKQKDGLKNLSLIYTGGTIGSRVDYRTGGVHMLTKPEELLYLVPEIADVANISINNLYSIASEDMSYLEWQGIARQIYKEANKGAHGIIVTHGTDTMHYTSAALSFMLQNLNIPVVITGAQRSSDRGSSDAFINLFCSAKLAASSDIAEVGICMHENSSDNTCTFIRGTKARKMHTSRRDAFKPINDDIIARVSKLGGIEYIGMYRKRNDSKSELKLLDKFEKKTALVKIYPNSDPEILDYYVNKGYKGIILEGTGLGHAPVSTTHVEYNWLKSIKNTVNRGIIVGMTSQCVYGMVNPNVYTNLRLISEAGAIYCRDMTAETAYIKLGWLLGNYRHEEAKQMLDQNISGEISDRITYNEFLDGE